MSLRISEPRADAAPQVESVDAEDYAADNSSEDVADAAAAMQLAEVADAENNGSQALTPADEDNGHARCGSGPYRRRQAPADELARQRLPRTPQTTRGH